MQQCKKELTLEPPQRRFAGMAKLCRAVFFSSVAVDRRSQVSESKGSIDLRRARCDQDRGPKKQRHPGDVTKLPAAVQDEDVLQERFQRRKGTQTGESGGELQDCQKRRKSRENDDLDEWMTVAAAG